MPKHVSNKWKLLEARCSVPVSVDTKRNIEQMVHLLSSFSCSKFNMPISLKASVLRSSQTNVDNLSSLLKELLTSDGYNEVSTPKEKKKKLRDYPNLHLFTLYIVG